MSEADRKLEADWNAAFANVMLVWPLIPDKGWGGELDCPCCKLGTVRWARAPSNRHVRFSCDTCSVSMIQ